MKSRFFVVILPVASLIISGVVAGVQVRRTMGAEADQTRLRVAVSKLKQAARPAEDINELLQIPAVPDTESEQADFLGELRTAANSAGIQLVKWNFVVKKANQSGKASGPTLENATPIECTLDVAGTFPALRSFLYDLAKAERFYAVGNVTWKRDRDKYPNTTLSFTLTRFVTGTAPTVATGNPGDSTGVTG